MKSKPLKHKSTNDFRFVPFAERISSIDIRHAALYHIEHAYTEQPQENESHFHLALRKWHGLNLSDNFKKFRKEVLDIVTLPQLLYKRSHVLKLLEEYLALDDTLCLQPLLELLVSIAKDLREEFYPHFPIFLDILIKLLKTKDAEKLEWVLVCLAFLFKILKSYLKKDIAAVIKQIVPLLSESQPQYINNFAAEGFAYTVRDILDKDKFITLILDYLQAHEDSIIGCGHLVFEITKGVDRKFHSCIETFLPLLLQHLQTNNASQEILFKVLTQTIEDCLQSISHKEFPKFWDPVLKHIEQNSLDGANTKGLEYILRLAGQVVEHCSGKYLTCYPQLILSLVKVICNQTSEQVLEVCSQIVTVLLLSPNISLSQEHTGIILKVTLSLPYPNLLINFVRNVIDYPQFDLRVLPHFLNFVMQSDFDNDAVSTLSRICLKKSPLSKNGMKLFEWVKYPLNFGSGLTLFEAYAKKILSASIEELLESPSKLLNLLICLPHIERICVVDVLNPLKRLVDGLIKILNSYNLENIKQEKLKYDCSALAVCVRKVLFALANVVECAVHTTNCKNIKDICDIDVFLQAILCCTSNPNFLSSLHLLDLYLTAYEQEYGLTYAQLLLVDSYLSDNITSPFHEVRLLTTHIYKLFENLGEFNKSIEVGGNVEKFAIFSMCHSVECIKPSIQEYRTQINLLQKMALNTTQQTISKETSFHLYPLKYMLGVLYTNFKLLWEPVCEFIAGYGNSLAAEEFWPLFYKALESSFTNANQNFKMFDFSKEFDGNIESFHNLYANFNNILEKPDLYNYRILLLKIMTSCIQVCEMKNRDVVTLFLNFIDNEYKNNKNTNVFKINVEIYSKDFQEIDSEKNLDNDNILDIEETNESASGKIVFKTLIHIMQVMAQFKNPKGLYKEPVFWDIYMEFLKHKNAGLQKFTLDCILNYKNKSVIKYKDNLYNLIDDKKFKDELALFKITEDAQNIQPEDRQHVVPLILRILYGKMTLKLGADKKSGGQARRSLIMRYLAGCSENEMKTFIGMAFSHFDHYTKMVPKEIFEYIYSNLDLKCIISPGKLQSALNLLEIVREYFGGYMKGDLLSDFLKIYYSICSMVGSVLGNENKVHVAYIKYMKYLRVLSLDFARKLFEQFEKYSWSKDELNVIFETLIWPLLPRLHFESANSPNALLKLIDVWCKNPRYHILLVTHSNKESELSILPELLKLLLAPKTDARIANTILDMIESLLLLTVDDDDKEPSAIETFNVEIEHDATNDTLNVNFGSKILLPHIPSILAVMKRRISNSAKSNSVNKRDLFILSRITELVATPEICDELLSMLLPILVKKICSNMAEENMNYAVTTISNLIGSSKNAHKYVRNIAILFNKVTPVDVRKLLIQMVHSVAQNAEEDKDAWAKISHIITEMNAFNKRWIEQPDFDRRLDAYKQIYAMSENDFINADLAILIVNNCFHFIHTEKDIGLRDSAGLCLKRILPKILLKHWSTSSGQFLIKDTILPLISTGIRDSKNDILRNESISLLGTLAAECPIVDVVFSDLTQLVNKEDKEVDFFENMCHLQMHRRVRALLKFCKVVKKMTKCPSPRTLTNFILPMASMYLCNEKYSDKNTLIDACIEVISTCCRLLPWYHYEVILKLYLNKLKHSSENQKQLTRIVIGILDAFHYDFSKAQNIEIPKSLFSNTEMAHVNIHKNAKDNVLKESEDMEVEEKPLEDEDIDSQLINADKEVANEHISKDVVEVPAFQKLTVVSPSVAKRIIKSLSCGLLPQLNRTISKLTDREESHKVNRHGGWLERQEEEMQRVPIALAVVKLLQRLPGDLLRHQLPPIIIKLCSFLKSPLKQVRLAARDIVKKIMLTVGSSYLNILLGHLTSLLTRGFQVHVLVSTIHVVLDSLKNDFKAGDINDNLKCILEVCTNDLFGALSEEKEVSKLHYKTPEAKPSKKSYVTLMIVAQNITDDHLIELIVPFKDVLQKHHSKKTVLKVQEALKHITTGLVSNKFIQIESLFTFSQAIASENIPQLVLGAPKVEYTEAQKEKMLREKQNCLIIPVAPKRNRELQARQVKTSARANAHVLVEFSLNILYVILKRELVSKDDCKRLITPITSLLIDALNSDNVSVVMVALKCITTLWLIKVSPQLLEERVQDVVKMIFSILHKYATSEISKQNDNYHLVRIAFKAVMVLMRNVNYYNLEVDQLKTLLLYIEQDCQSDERQANSFALLKAILEVKLVSPELHEIMVKVARISILSESARSREDARNLFAMYLLNYQLGRKMEKHMNFFISQLKFELQHGRESALNFLHMIIKRMKENHLIKQGPTLLLSLGAAMSSDDAPSCRADAAACIETLLSRLGLLHRNSLFEMVLNFFQDNQVAHYELAAQLCIRFVNVEKADFQRQLDCILPIIGGKLMLLRNDVTEGRFVTLRLEQDGDKTDEDRQRGKDHCLIQILNLIDTITTLCPASLNSAKHYNEYDEIAQQCQALLAYPHAWVRIKCAKILHTLLSAVDVASLDAAMDNASGECVRGFIYSDTETAIRSLVLDLCAQYTPSVTREMADQATATLFVILNLVHSISRFKLSDTVSEKNEDKETGGRLNIRWILFKLRKAVNVEVTRAPNSMNIRTSIFTMWLHIISSFSADDVTNIVDIMIAPLVRELSVCDAAAPQSPARHLAGRMAKKLRRKLGDIEFSKMAAEAQTRLNKRRAERKKVLLQEKVHNPEKASKRKMQLKEKKKQAKKIKLEMIRGKRPRPKKRKAEEFDVEDELLKDD